ncbi:Hypothetical protein NTJ_04661 [Nesidiocoris tenuis]|uniref:Uncharacterized protein n=1 Tax=Nesidiocoris tenuis TaxID=355587 RepID=A0ABN7AIS7_9HEMI|nr:Hypothetical protein NTJ_04661 [Nesidiocoris tenuis]
MKLFLQLLMFCILLVSTIARIEPIYGIYFVNSGSLYFQDERISGAEKFFVQKPEKKIESRNPNVQVFQENIDLRKRMKARLNNL